MPQLSLGRRREGGVQAQRRAGRQAGACRAAQTPGEAGERAEEQLRSLSPVLPVPGTRPPLRNPFAGHRERRLSVGPHVLAMARTRWRGLQKSRQPAGHPSPWSQTVDCGAPSCVPSRVRSDSAAAGTACVGRPSPRPGWRSAPVIGGSGAPPSVPRVGPPGSAWRLAPSVGPSGGLASVLGQVGLALCLATVGGD